MDWFDLLAGVGGVDSISGWGTTIPLFSAWLKKKTPQKPESMTVDSKGGRRQTTLPCGGVWGSLKRTEDPTVPHPGQVNPRTGSAENPEGRMQRHLLPGTLAALGAGVSSRRGPEWLQRWKKLSSAL